MPLDPRILTGQSLSENYSGVLNPASPRPMPNPRANNVVQDIDNYQREQNMRTLLQFPHDRSKYFFMIAISQYSRDNLTSVRGNLNTVSNVVLPVPATITDRNQVSYGQYEFGAWGPAVQAGMNALGGTAGMTNVLQGQLPTADAGSGVDNSVGSQIGNTLAGTGAAAAGNAGAVGAAGQVLLGLSPNQFFTILLKGPVYKTLSFQWYLAPRTFEESETIRNIIKELNNASAPGLALGGAIFSFPHICQCAFMPNYNYLFRMKPAVIDSISADFAPGQPPSFYHEPPDKPFNPPESVKLEITFQELEYWLYSDYKGDEAGPFNTTGGDRAGNNPFAGAADEKLREIISTAGSAIKKSIKATSPEAVRRRHGIKTPGSGSATNPKSILPTP